MKFTVIQVLPALEVGGVERGTIEVAAELVRLGHRSVVISAGGRLEKDLQETGSEHICLAIGKKSPFTLRHIHTLRRIIMETRANILHVRSRFPAWIAYFAWRGLPVSQRPHFITGVHGPYTVNRYSKIMLSGEKVIAISGYIYQYILANYPGIDIQKIAVIHRGIDPQQYPFAYTAPVAWRQHWKKQYPHLNDKFILTLPARITRWKGQNDFIEIVKRLLDLGLPVHGLIAGGAAKQRQGFLHQLEQQVRTAGIADRITFLGHRDDLKEIMSVSDIVCSLAKTPEAFGRTALEALSMGIPVIGYDHGGASEILSELFPEGRIQPGDVNAAVRLAVEFHKAAPKISSGNPFTLQAMLDKTMRLYEEAYAGLLK